jgi:hypothetical protein
MLIHQIPAKPNYLRIRIGRRLTRIGALALKNSVYVLPRSDDTLEDFQWVLREIISAGGSATLVEATLIDGVSDEEVEAMFEASRNADYEVVVNELRSLEAEVSAPMADAQGRRFENELSRLERQMAEIEAIDFFHARTRDTARQLLASLRERASKSSCNAPGSANIQRGYRARTWVTRAGVGIDRIASAWLIRRFVDADARFKFVPARGYAPEQGELRFDMFDAEFTHEGELCTFEVLCARFELARPGLTAVGELVHDIDLKDGKFGRAEAAGLAAQIDGLLSRQKSDEARLQRGFELFDDLLAYFARRS